MRRHHETNKRKCAEALLKLGMMRDDVRMGIFPMFVNSLGRPDDMRIGRGDDVGVLASVGNGM